MSTVDEATRCIEKLNGVVRGLFYNSLRDIGDSCKFSIGVEWPSHPRRLLCY